MALIADFGNIAFKYVRHRRQEPRHSLFRQNESDKADFDAVPMAVGAKARFLFCQDRSQPVRAPAHSVLVSDACVISRVLCNSTCRHLNLVDWTQEAKGGVWANCGHFGPAMGVIRGYSLHSRACTWLARCRVSHIKRGYTHVAPAVRPTSLSHLFS